MSEIQIQNGAEPKMGPGPDNGGPENKKKKTKKLGHEELLRLLSVFEGELQARDEAIQILKSQVRQANTAREALKRDASYTNASDDEKTGNSVNQLKSIIEHQKDSLRKVKREMCLTDEKLNILTEELEREKVKHSDYMEKSDEFVNLLETDRQKLKLALEKEKALNDGQVRQYEKLKRETSEEIDKLKKFSMLLVEEKQSAMKREERHNERIKAAESEIQELEEALETLLKKYEAEQEHSNTLEGELEELSDRQQQEIADLETKLEQEKKKTNELEEQINIKQAQVNKLKAMHKNLRRTDDHLLQLKEKLEKEGDREDLEAEVIQLRERIEELEEGEKNQLNEAEFRKQIENEIKAIEDLENELDRLRKTALIHKQIERFVEDSMFKLDELTARHDFEEKKTLDMETGIMTLKTNLTELDEGSAKIMLIEEDLRKEFRLIEEESKKEKGLEVGNAMMAAVILERDELEEKCKSLQVDFNELQEATLNHAREGMKANIPAEETANLQQVSELKKQLEDQSEVMISLEAEIKKLNHQAKMKLQGSSEDITNFEIKLLATEEDLEATKTLLKKEEATTAKQSLQVKMLKERLLKLEEIEDKYKHQVEQVRKTNKKSNEASLEETNMRRQLDDIKTVLEEEVKDRKLIEKELKTAKKILKNYEKEASKAEIGIQTDEEYPSRPTSRISERFGAISPAIQIFDGPRAHRIVPGGFRGCNFAAGMAQESLVRPSSIKQQRIKIPPPASSSTSDKQISMTFVHDINNEASGNSDSNTASSGKDENRKCVLKITKDKQTGAPVIVPPPTQPSPPTQSTLSPPQASGPRHVALKTKENTIKLVKNEQSGKIQVSQEVTHIGQTEAAPSAPIGRNVTSIAAEESESKMSEVDLDSKKSKSPEKSQKIYTKVERVRKKRNVFERAASAFEKADQVQKTSRRFIQSTMESASEKTSKLGKQEVSDMVGEASSVFGRNGSIRTSKRTVRSHSRQSSLAGDVSDGHIKTSAGASSGVTLSKSISTESITSGRTSKTGSSSLSNLSSISTPSPTQALNNSSATKPIQATIQQQQNGATKIEEEKTENVSVAEKECTIDAARSQACLSPDSEAKARGRGRSQGRRRSHSKNRESSLVRQRAAQWKEKEALGGRLPIPVPKAKD